MNALGWLLAMISKDDKATTRMPPTLLAPLSSSGERKSVERSSGRRPLRALQRYSGPHETTRNYSLAFFNNDTLCSDKDDGNSTFVQVRVQINYYHYYYN